MNTKDFGCMQGTLFIISGPSGVGKTTVVNEILQKHSHIFKRLITYTTKPPRHTEVPGHDYHFVSDEEFMHKVQTGFFLEYSDAYIYKYGTPAFVMEDIKKGMNYIVIMDRAGVQSLKNMGIPCVAVWLCPESLDVLAERLRKRGTENEEKMQKRLQRAQVELSCELEGQICDFAAPVLTIEQGVQDVSDILFTVLQKNITKF